MMRSEDEIKSKLQTYLGMKAAFLGIANLDRPEVFTLMQQIAPKETFELFRQSPDVRGDIGRALVRIFDEKIDMLRWVLGEAEEG